MKLMILFIIFLGMYSPLGKSKTLSIGLMAGDRPPYYMIRDGAPKGIFVDILNFISKETNLKFDIRILPQPRILNDFARGNIDIEAAVSPKWRQSKKHSKISVYSKPILQFQEVLISPKGKLIPKVNNWDELIKLKSYKIAHVRGFFLPFNLTATYLSDEYSVANFIEINRADVGLMNLHVACYYKYKDNFKYNISPIYDKESVSLRIHINKKHHLPVINKAINKLKKGKNVDVIINKYLGIMEKNCI